MSTPAKKTSPKYSPPIFKVILIDTNFILQRTAFHGQFPGLSAFPEPCCPGPMRQLIALALFLLSPSLPVHCRPYSRAPKLSDPPGIMPASPQPLPTSLAQKGQSDELLSCWVTQPALCQAPRGPPFRINFAIFPPRRPRLSPCVRKPERPALFSTTAPSRPQLPLRSTEPPSSRWMDGLAARARASNCWSVLHSRFRCGGASRQRRQQQHPGIPHHSKPKQRHHQWHRRRFWAVGQRHQRQQQQHHRSL